MFRKIQLLEEASIDLLKKEIYNEQGLRLAKDFLKFFKLGITQHFKVEEEALFPILRNVFQSEEQIISRLILEHKLLIQKYSRLQKLRNPTVNQLKRIMNFLAYLSAHARKEEEKLPSLIETLDERQLRMIDEKAKSLGYPILTS